MKLKPIGKNIVIKIIEEKEKITKNNIIIPVKNNDKKQKAEVVEISKETKEVKIGDIVLLNKNYGNEIIIENENYKIVTEEQILAIIKK